MVSYSSFHVAVKVGFFLFYIRLNMWSLVFKLTWRRVALKVVLSRGRLAVLFELSPLPLEATATLAVIL